MKFQDNIKVLAVAALCLFFSLAVEVQAGSITGRVLDSSNNPVPNLRVDVCAAAKNNGNIDWKTSSLVKTKSDGSYTWPNLTPGDYKVRYSANTVPELGLATEWYNDQTDFDAATSITVGAGAVPLDDVILSGSGSISGTVTNGTSGIKGVSVYVYDSSGSWLSTLTGDYGEYKITNLPTGNYKVQFSGGNVGYISEYYNDKIKTNADSVPVDAPYETGNINAVLDSGRIISGKVTILETGAPLAGAWISVCDSSTTASCPSGSNPDWKNSAITGTDGSYTVGGLSASGSYKVQFFEKMVNNAGYGMNKWYSGTSDVSNAEVISLSAGNVDNVNMAFNGASISGTVTKAGAGNFADVTVEACDSSGQKVASSKTGTDGFYNIAGLLRGNYKLYFKALGTTYVSEWYNDAPSIGTANPVEITSLANALTDKDAELAAGGSISGKVEIQRNPDSTPVPVDGGLVLVYDSTDASILRGAATTRSDGTYDVTGLPTTDLKVRFFSSAAADGSAGYGASEWYNNKFDFSNADTVTTADVNADQINAVLEPSNLIPAYKLLLLKKRY